ncbi:hypothetical protein B1729_09990 [Microbacterium sp. B35-04]|uniref:universal stress protein n=1 Tax=Microbacterium sp. B35-04 TaxID=1961716 RepID=UPI0013D3BD01|nr:universal stress protein [Microbacterium sp. B35-04]KAF2413441.1 hypothetical protein B1729_09990 [Microbacterium sp. B35-04]
MAAGPIVAGVTDRPVSRRVTDWAADRAVAEGRELVLISVVGGSLGRVGRDEVLTHALAGADALAAKEVERMAGRGLRMRIAVSHGNPTATLIEESTDAALLVIGSDIGGEGHDGRRGPHGRRIVAGAHSTVVVVPDIDVSARSGVVVGVDGSELSQRALAFAADEAAKADETLTAVSVWMPVALTADYGLGAGYYPDSSYLIDLQDETERMVEGLVEPVRAEYPSLHIDTHVAEGDPGSAINDVASAARLAVVGTHGRTGISRLLLGSVSEHVLAELSTVTAVVR